MGEDEVKSLEDVQDDDVLTELPTDNSEHKSDDNDLSEDASKADTDDGIEIVRSHKEGTQPDKQSDLDRIINRRLKREKRKIESANDTASEASKALEIERHKNQLLQLALDQKKKTDDVSPPNPDEFIHGVSDPAYIDSFNTYQRNYIQEEVKKQSASLNVSRNANDGLEQVKRKHYQKAYALGASDYEDVEDKAIDALGADIVDHLIQSSDNAHVVLYFLGKNPDEAEELSALIKSDPIKGTLRIGRLEAELQVQSKAKSKPSPDPDEELSGGTPSASDHLKRKYEKLVSKAQEGGSQSQKYMKAMADLRKEAQAKGVDLRK